MTNITVSINKNSAEIEYNHQCVYLLIMMYNNIGDRFEGSSPAINDDDWHRFANYDDWHCIANYQ